MIMSTRSKIKTVRSVRFGRRTFWRIACGLLWGFIFVVLGIQIYSIMVSPINAQASLPALFGNTQSVVDALTAVPSAERFSFAVVGDTRSHGTFKRIARAIRKEDPNFVVLLGDCVFTGKPQEHVYFQNEYLHDINFPCPTFYIVGNHDVCEDSFSVDAFEKTYGPSNFSFEYGGCLFIALRILDPPYSNRESLAYLRSFSRQKLATHKHRFLMMHIPPPVSPLFKARSYPEANELTALIDTLGIDYVLAGDFHGYCRTNAGNADYIVTGGGGAKLKQNFGPQFHHAVMLHVGKEFVSERILRVAPTKEFGKKLKRAAIVEIEPFLRNHFLPVCLADALLILIGIMMIIRLSYHRE